MPNVGHEKMKKRFHNIRRPIALLALIAISLFLIRLCGRDHALITQPLDYVTAIVTEIRSADSPTQGWRMVKGVSAMFWVCFEVRMHDGRAFSGIPRYPPAIPNEDLKDTNDVVVTIH